MTILVLFFLHRQDQSCSHMILNMSFSLKILKITYNPSLPLSLSQRPRHHQTPTPPPRHLANNLNVFGRWPGGPTEGGGRRVGG